MCFNYVHDIVVHGIDCHDDGGHHLQIHRIPRVRRSMQSSTANLDVYFCFSVFSFAAVLSSVVLRKSGETESVVWH